MNTFTSQDLAQADEPLIVRPAGGSSSYSILVVDEDAAIRGMLDVALRGFGFSVQLAAGSYQAHEMYRQQAFDIVLMDLRTAPLDGVMTMVKLLEFDPRAVCCFMSGDLGPYTVEDLYFFGAAGVIQKPFHLLTLRQMLSKALAHDRSRRASTLPPDVVGDRLSRG